MKASLVYPHFGVRFFKGRKEVSEDVQTLAEAETRRDALRETGHSVLTLYKVEQRGQVLAHIQIG